MCIHKNKSPYSAFVINSAYCILDNHETCSLVLEKQRGISRWRSPALWEIHRRWYQTAEIQCWFAFFSMVPHIKSVFSNLREGVKEVKMAPAITVLGRQRQEHFQCLVATQTGQISQLQRQWKLYLKKNGGEWSSMHPVSWQLCCPQSPSTHVHVQPPVQTCKYIIKHIHMKTNS